MNKTADEEGFQEFYFKIYENWKKIFQLYELNSVYQYEYTYQQN